MRIHDPSLFSLILPTFEGTRFLMRALDYLEHVGYEGRIVLSDNSSGEHRAFVAGCAARYARLDIEAHLYPQHVRFLDKMVATLERIASPFVMLHAHDDFMVPLAVESCVKFLAENTDYSVARGRVAMVTLQRVEEPESQVRISIVPHPMRAYEQQDGIDRVVEHIEHYSSTFYSVHRRDHLMEAFGVTEAATKNVIFFQYLSSCISALRGKIRCSDDLFYVRQGHGDSWSATQKKDNYEHWPLLITSPDFSRYYGEFRNTLSRLIEAIPGTPAGEPGRRIDRAAIGLFQRGFCNVERDNIAEARFLARLNDPVSEENRLLKSIVQFAIQYRDTL